MFTYLKKQKITCITATHDKNDALAFANKIIVIKQGKQLSARSPQEMFANPTDQYSASLLSEINIVPLTFFYPVGEEKNILLYPHEIELAQKNSVNATVTDALFMGTYFLIKAMVNDYAIVFQHATYIAKATIVGISVKKNVIEQRMKL
ncbi:hypothetical protein [Aquimarina agarivorans]|uniref:hypothetical protein n=1 Tax=Aquimarina agarivorans TaxID=980584 RepID=UPI000248FCE5|nr:hypothetical protein [Aquimarina agarivorans]